MHTKRILTSIAIIFICFMAFLDGFKSADFVYADSSVDDWQNVTTNEQLVDAFRYYCKSRDLTIEGSAADVITSFTTQIFNDICNGLGIDVTALQAHLKYETDGSNIRYLFDSTGITAYNRIFAQFLQDNDLEVGDTNVNKTLYSGVNFINYDGSSCLVTITENVNSSNNYANISYMGTALLPYSSGYWTSLIDSSSGSSLSCSVVCATSANNNSIYTFVNNITRNQNNISWLGATCWRRSYVGPTQDDWLIEDFDTFMTVLYKPSTGQYFLGVVSNDNGRYKTNSITNRPIFPKVNTSTDPITIIIVAPTINNNTYEGDTIINPDGTPSTPSTPSDPTPDPPTPDPPEDWDIDMPDLDINWILTGKEQKFPWDIPFNIMFALSLLNAEPKTPEIEGTLDLKVYQWNYKLDLHQFDDVAEVCRNFEFLAFLIGLMLMTKKLIWG